MGVDSGLSWQVLRNKGVYESVKYIQQENFWIGPSSVRSLPDPWPLVSCSALCFLCPELRGFSEVLLSSGEQSMTSSLQPAVLGPWAPIPLGHMSSQWDAFLPSLHWDNKDLGLLSVETLCPC